MPPEAYLELFTRLGWQADVWETTYLHVLKGDDPVFSWISSTGARPIIQALPDGAAAGRAFLGQLPDLDLRAV